MSKKENVQEAVPPTTSNLTGTTAPAFKQISTTLRFCLRYADGKVNIFKRLLQWLDSTDIITLTTVLSEEELQRLVPLIAERMTNIRMVLKDIAEFKEVFQARGVSELSLIRSCEIMPPKSEQNNGRYSKQLLLLGQVLPQLQLLNLKAALSIPFPDNLRHLRVLIVHQSIVESMFNQICENCPQLQQLYLRNVTDPDVYLDIAFIVNCDQLRNMQLPLMLKTPGAVGQLDHLANLILQRPSLWPGMEWLPILKEIIYVKRYQLQLLSFDGTWLATPLDLSLLQLHNCWALQQLLFSNCKLADPTDNIKLPLSCERISLKDCTLNNLIFSLHGTAKLRLLELYKCSLLNKDGLFLSKLLLRRQVLPILYPLQVRFSASTELRSELLSWQQDISMLQGKWLQIREVNDNEMTWNPKIATIDMKFGKRVNYTPDLDELLEYPNPTPADLLREL